MSKSESDLSFSRLNIPDTVSEYIDSEESANGDTDKDLVDDIRKHFKEFCVKADEHTKNNLIVIGHTGEGKSTLINYLAGNKLVAMQNKYKKSEYKVDAPNSLGNIKIGHDKSSETKMPNKWVSQDDGITYWDCPGFNDTSGTRQDIVNAFYVNKLFNNSEKSKIVLVVSSDTIFADRIDKFLILADNVAKLGLIDSLDNVSLVVTKSETDIEVLRECFSDILKTTNNENLKKLTEFFIKHENQIAFFSKPEKAGEIDCAEKEKIHKLIENAQFFTGKVNLSISDKAENDVNKYKDQLNKKIEGLFENKVIKSIKIIHDDIVGNKLSYSELQSKFKKLKENSGSLSLAKNKDKFIEEYNKIKENLSIANKEEDEELEEELDLLNFFGKITRDDDAFRFAKCQGQFHKIDKLVTHLKGSNEQIDDGNVRSIKDPILEAGNFNALANQENVKSVNVFAYSFYFNEDIKLHGKNLNIFAHCGHIEGNRKIDLSGKKGDDYSANKALNGHDNKDGDGKPGSDGLPGKAGKPGGNLNLYFKNLVVQPNGKLTIDVSGGQGGTGQNGGDGYDGRDGKEGSAKHVYERNQEECIFSRKKFTFSDKTAFGKVVHVGKALGTFNGQMLETYESKSAPGGKGGDGGRGGAGGLGGLAGNVELSENLQEIVLVEKKEGAIGSEGEAGNPGKGGKNGGVWYGEYINEMVFPSFRKAGSEFDGGSIINATCTTGADIGGGAAYAVSRDVVLEGGKKAGAELLNQAVVETGKEGVKQLTTEVSKDVLVEAMKQLSIESGKDVANEMLLQAMLNGGKELSVEGAKQILSMTGKEIGKEIGKDFLAEGLKQVAVEGGKDVLVEAMKQLSIEGGKDVANEMLLQAMLNGGKELSVEGAKQILSMTGKEIGKEIGKDFVVEGIKQLTIEGGKDVANEMLLQAMLNGGKELSVEGAKQILSMTSKEIGKEIGKDFVVEGMKQLTIEGGKDVANEMLVQAMLNGGKELSVEGFKQVALEGGKEVGKEVGFGVAKSTAKNAAIGVVESSTSAAASTGFSVANFAKSMAGGIVIQTGVSIVSAYASSGWLVGPEERSEGQGSAEDGNKPDALNDNERESAEKPHDYVADTALYDDFVENEINNNLGIIIGENEARSWFSE